MPEVDISEEVTAALADGRPVVALESTLITHGFSAPDNLTVAFSMEKTVREHGGVPATIAVFDGQITVGMKSGQLERLAAADPVRKCSPRDLPVVIAGREDGATTVAATMAIAHRVGVRVMATGGIGGVHRGIPWDRSSDLTELARTPVAVVCSGAKAILDLPLTREVLETYGVTVVGYRTDEWPAFYARCSGLAVDVRADSPAEVAQIVRLAHDIGMSGGPLVTVPVPATDEWPAEEADAVIRQAVEDARTERISGKNLTPYLLARIGELSGGRSGRANKALLTHNASVAADVARALAHC